MWTTGPFLFLNINPYQYPFVQPKPGSQKPFYGDQTASGWLAVSFLTIQRYSAPWVSNCRVNSLGCVEGIKQIRSSGYNSKLWDFKISMVSAWQTLVVLFAYYSWAIVYIPCQKQAGPQEALASCCPRGIVQAWRWIPKQAVNANKTWHVLADGMAPSGYGTQLAFIFSKISWFSTTQSY